MALYNGSHPAPPGRWKLIDSGVHVLPNSTLATLVTGYSPAVGEAMLGIVSPSGGSSSAIHNDNTNQNPGTNDVHWCLTEVAGAVNLTVRSGSQGGCTLYWALYSVVP